MGNPTASTRGEQSRARLRLPKGATALLMAVLALGLTLAVAACGSDDDASAGDGSQPGSGKKLVMITTLLDDFTYTVSEGASAEAEELGAEFELEVPPRPEVASQAATLRAVIAQRPDGILIAPLDGEALSAPIREATEQGIKVITHDSDTEDKDVRESFVSADFPEAGRIAGEEMVQLVDGEGTVLFLNAITGFTFFDETEAGFREVVEPEAGINLLPTRLTEGDTGKTNSTVTATLAAEPDLTGIHAGTIPEIQGTVSALRAADKVGDIAVTAWDGTTQAVKLLKEGTIDVVVSVPGEEYGRRSARLAIDAINGEEVPSTVTLEPCLLTQETVDDPENAPCLYDKTPG